MSHRITSQVASSHRSLVGGGDGGVARRRVRKLDVGSGTTIVGLKFVSEVAVASGLGYGPKDGA
jgi:hypothetical protein